MTDYLDALARELDLWGEAGACAEFWWRDDDAISATQALDTLLEIASQTPVALAVIPALVETSLATRLNGEENVFVLQHGWIHQNYAESGPNSEFPPNRDLDVVTQEFIDGRARLSSLFGDRFLPVFVPPWHGFDERYVVALETAGLRGLSIKGNHHVTGRLKQVNIQCVPIAWTDPPSFGDAHQYVSQIVDHLKARRGGEADLHEPTGILTHHLVQNDDSFAFVQRIVELVENHSASCWRSAQELFA